MFPKLSNTKDLNNLVQAVRRQLIQAGEKTIFDFTKPSQDLKETWGASTTS